MTRTERSTSPRAVLKDRSESKSGFDKSLRKGGAGAHNWGSIRDELDLERDALEDEEFDTEELGVSNKLNAAVRPSVDVPSEDEIFDKTNGATGADDAEKAREYRANALKGKDIDLASVARTSAGARSEPPTGTIEVTRDATTGTLQ